jgi:hypothetical protein
MQTRTLFAALGIALTVALAPSKTHAATTFTFDGSLNGLSSFKEALGNRGMSLLGGRQDVLGPGMVSEVIS